MWFGTYILETTDDKVLRKPVHGSRLTRYVPRDVGVATIVLTHAWRETLRTSGETIEYPSEEIMEILGKEDKPPSYHDLSLMSKGD